jgi:hypothetical protein
MTISAQAEVSARLFGGARSEAADTHTTGPAGVARQSAEDGSEPYATVAGYAEIGIVFARNAQDERILAA